MVEEKSHCMAEFSVHFAGQPGEFSLARTFKQYIWRFRRHQRSERTLLVNWTLASFHVSFLDESVTLRWGYERNLLFLKFSADFSLSPLALYEIHTPFQLFTPHGFKHR